MGMITDSDASNHDTALVCHDTLTAEIPGWRAFSAATNG
jgi:hypothetical protein